MKIWMSQNNKEGKATLSLMGYFLCLILFTFITIMPTIIFYHDSLIALMIWFIITTVVYIVSAVRMGASHTRDNLLFLRDNKMSLFVVDISKFVRYRRGFLGLFIMERDKERILKSAISEKKFESHLMQESSLHGLEIEIECIESMKVRRDGINIVCHVIYPNRNKGRVSYFVKNGYEDQESLIVDLESRLLPFGDERIIDRSHTGKLLLSGFLLFINIILCVMSHPITGLLSVSYYFYFLGAVAITGWCFLYVIVKIRRGL